MERPEKKRKPAEQGMVEDDLAEMIRAYDTLLLALDHVQRGLKKDEKGERVGPLIVAWRIDGGRVQTADEWFSIF